MHRLLWIAGLLQIGIAAANLPLRSRLGMKSEDARLSPLVRQIHVVHYAYLMGLLAAFGAMSLLFSRELTGGEPLGVFLSLLLSVFWAARVAVQRLVYDPAALRAHRAADIGFTMIFAGLSAVYAAAALGGLR
jgi:hypothetical protein